MDPRSAVAHGDPIFVISNSGRSGTNYLASLLDAHPDCGRPLQDEDFLTAYSDSLARYADEVFEEWRHVQHVDRSDRDELLTGLGRGLLSYLEGSIDAPRLVAKTPSIDGIEHFFTLFPNAYLVILVRDGRAVLESHHRSFGTNPQRIVRGWAEGARRLERFRQQHPPAAHRYCILKYEDLFARPREELRALLQFLDLDVERYDLEAVEDWPILGSSQPLGAGASEFTPLERWQSWSRRDHEQFNHLAGPELALLGYEPLHAGDRSLLGRATGLLTDVHWTARRATIALVRAAGREEQAAAVRERFWAMQARIPGLGRPEAKTYSTARRGGPPDDDAEQPPPSSS